MERTDEFVIDRASETGEPTENERERKFVLSEGDAALVLHEIELRMRRVIYDRSRPHAWIRTTYLDTDDLALLHSASRIGIARKVRIREYAGAAPGRPPVLNGACWLELKESTGGMRTKARFAAPPEVIRELVESAGSRCRAGLHTGPILAIRSVRALLRRYAPKPRVTTWYRRDTFASMSGALRVTLDEGFAVCRPAFCGEAGTRALPPEVVATVPSRVLELKHTGPAPLWLERLVGELDPSETFSKFTTAVQALAGR